MSVRSVAPRRPQQTSMVIARLRVQMGYACTLCQVREIVKGHGRDGWCVHRRCLTTAGSSIRRANESTPAASAPGTSLGGRLKCSR